MLSLLATLFTGLATFGGAVASTLLRGQYWRAWTAYLLVVTSLYVVTGWSFWEVATGARSAEEHLLLMRFIEPLRLLHPGLLIAVLTAQVVHQLHSVQAEMSRLEELRLEEEAP